MYLENGLLRCEENLTGFRWHPVAVATQEISDKSVGSSKLKTDLSDSLSQLVNSLINVLSFTNHSLIC